MASNRLVRGFTLVELLIVVVIVAILASVALPSYNRQVTDTRRTDAHIALAQLAQRQERFHSLNNTYATTLTDLVGATTFQSEQGFYNVALTNPNCTTGGYTGCFVLTATAVAEQAGDAACATLSLDQMGAQSATGSNPAECWD